jgi:hypothetical protein
MSTALGPEKIRFEGCGRFRVLGALRLSRFDCGVGAVLP